MGLNKKTILTVAVLAVLLLTMALIVANSTSEPETTSELVSDTIEDISVLEYSEQFESEVVSMPEFFESSEEPLAGRKNEPVLRPAHYVDINEQSDFFVSNDETSDADNSFEPENGQKQYSICVNVKGANGYPISNASVVLGEETTNTDARGIAYISSNDSTAELIVFSSGYVPYYEILDLTGAFLPLDIVMDDADDIRTLLDSAELRPYQTDCEDLEAFMDVLFDQIFEPNFDTYDKVKACYDWLIDNTVYKSPHHWDSAKNYWLCAYQTMVEGIGTCNCYSAAFTAMMRHIGLDCYIVTGYTTANLGGMTSHDWTTMKINDKWYIFDAQVEDAVAGRTRSKEVTYVRFCLAEPHAKYRYSVYSRDKCVDRFQSYMDDHGFFLDDVDD